MRRPRNETAMEVVRLCDGTRTARQIAEEMGGVHVGYVNKTVHRRGIRHLLVTLPKGEGLKTLLRRTEKERDAYKSIAEKMVGELAEMKRDLSSTRERLQELERNILT